METVVAELMRCPICGSNLKRSGVKRIETIDDHVTDPNGEGSLHMTYQCPLCPRWVFFDEMGDVYVDDINEHKTLPEQDRLNLLKGAIGSFARKYNEEEEKRRASTYTLKFWAIMIRLVTFPAWSIEIWRKEHGYYSRLIKTYTNPIRELNHIIWLCNLRKNGKVG